MKKIIIPALCLLFCLSLSAQSKPDSVSTATKDSLPPHRKIVELSIDEKIIYVNELGLPPNTMVIDALSMFPEILGRDMESTLNKFDVQIDDVSVGSSKYSVLLHTMISEIHHVEITTDPSVSQSSNGVGGVIDIITLAVDSGFSGNVSCDIATNLKVTPSVSMAYKKDKLTVYGSFLFDYYHFNTNKNVFEEEENTQTWTRHNNYHNGFSEAMKFGLAYQFNKRDKLTFWLLQNFDKTQDSTIQTLNRVAFVDGNGYYSNGKYAIESPAVHTQIDAILKFERLYDRPSHKLYASLAYNNNYADDSNKQYTSGHISGYENYSYISTQYVKKPHNVSTSLYYRFHLLPPELAHILKLKAGFNSSMNFAQGTDYTEIQDVSIFTDYTQNFSVTPYLTFYYEWDKLNMELSMKYRFKASRGRGEDSDWQTNYFNNILGNFNITYKPVPNHQLRASTARSMTTPNNVQLYGKMYYKEAENKYYQGNPNLKETEINNVDLQYFYQYQGKKHEFQLNFAIEYVNANNLITKETAFNEEYKRDVVTWTNSNKTNHIFDGRLSLFWQTGIFSITFAGNFYDQIEKMPDSGKLSHYYYYNLMLQPVLHFERGWIVSGSCTYNSKIYNGSITTGDAIFMDLNVSKSWGPWSARLKFENTYNYLSTDVMKVDDKITTSYYNLYQCQIMVGFTYLFHVPNKHKKA